MMKFVFRNLVILIAASFILKQAVYAGDFGQDYILVVNIEQELDKFAKDIHSIQREMISRRNMGDEYNCISSIEAVSWEFYTAIGYYKYSLAILDMIEYTSDKIKVRGLLLIETNQLKGGLQANLDTLNRNMESCSRFSVSAVKRNELWTTLRKAADVLDAISRKF